MHAQYTAPSPQQHAARICAAILANCRRWFDGHQTHEAFTIQQAELYAEAYRLGDDVATLLGWLIDARRHSLNSVQA